VVISALAPVAAMAAPAAEPAAVEVADEQGGSSEEE
jgi:hypothetical protein